MLQGLKVLHTQQENTQEALLQRDLKDIPFLFTYISYKMLIKILQLSKWLALCLLEIANG